MLGLIQSQTKMDVLVCLALRGGASGRRLARLLRKSATPVFKALKGLEQNYIVKKMDTPNFYYLNNHYAYYPELINIIHKMYNSNIQNYHFLPKINPERKIDPYFIYEVIKLRGITAQKPIEKLSDILLKKHA